MVIVWPVLTTVVASLTRNTAGILNSRATTAPCDKIPPKYKMLIFDSEAFWTDCQIWKYCDVPSSVTRPAIKENKGVQPGLVWCVTKISPGWTRSASFRSVMTLALPKKEILRIKIEYTLYFIPVTVPGDPPWPIKDFELGSTFFLLFCWEYKSSFDNLVGILKLINDSRIVLFLNTAWLSCFKLPDLTISSNSFAPK